MAPITTKNISLLREKSTLTIFVGAVSTMNRRATNRDNKEDDEFHLWNPKLESNFGIRL